MHDESVTSVGIELEGNLDMHYVNMWLSKLLSEQGVDLFRSKGILAIEGTDDRYVCLFDLSEADVCLYCIAKS